MTEKVLLVDDDPNLLDALRRQYRKRFDLMTAEGGDAALDCFGDGTTVAVSVVDMRMPGMDGLQLLRRIREVSPDTVRIMLTGNADQQTAVDATAARVISHDAAKITHLNSAYNMGLGQIQEDRITIDGATLGELQVDWEPAQLA